MSVSCPECGSDHIAERWPTRRISGPKEILWCGACGFGWQHPLPSPEDIQKHYQNSPPYVLQGENEKREGFRRRIQHLARIMPSRGKLLDVGSGLGYFLDMARQDGWQVEGVEPQRSAAAYCKKKFGIAPHTGPIEQLDLQPALFDVVTLWDVLEHVHHPSRFLTTCLRLLKPEGLTVIAVPNASGWPARLFKGQWRYVMSTHLNYYTRTTVETLLARHHVVIEKESHTLKVQSLLQRVESWFPSGFRSEQILRMGRQETIEHGRPEQRQSSRLPRHPVWVTNTLSRCRGLILKLNLKPIAWPVGDLMDLYCRKVS